MRAQFSSRLDWHAPVNRIAERIAARRAAGAPIVDLTESNPTRTMPWDRAMLPALADPRALTYEPSAFGLPAAREAIAAWYGQQGIAADPARMLLTASTSEAYSFLFRLLADPGGEVLVPRPSYPLFDYLARLDGLTVRQYPLHHHEGWWMDLDELERMAGAETRAVVVVNPNNPTGSFVKRGEWQRLSGWCAGRGIAVISDEVFAPFAFAADEDRVPFAAAESEALVFSLNGLSKSCGLPQMKLGWIAAGGPREVVDAAMGRLELIADTYLPASAPVQFAAERWLSQSPVFRGRLMDRLRRNLAQAAPLRPLPVEGGWYTIVPAPRTRSEEDWTLALLDRGVLVQPGFFYDFSSEAFLVLSLLPEPAEFARGVAGITEVLGEG